MVLKKLCVLVDGKVCDGCGECDRCDLDPNKTCDNCMRCLDLEGGAEYRSIAIAGIVLNENDAD